MIYCFDIDGTICFTEKNFYEQAIPDIKMVEKINQLYDEGSTIIYWTARGSRTKIDWRELTTRQLNEWGAKHHGLKLDKPHYDLYVDDKSINAITFFKEAKKGE